MKIQSLLEDEDLTKILKKVTKTKKTILGSIKKQYQEIFDVAQPLKIFFTYCDVNTSLVQYIVVYTFEYYLERAIRSNNTFYWVEEEVKKCIEGTMNASMNHKEFTRLYEYYLNEFKKI